MNWCYLRRSKKDKCLKFTQRHKAVDRQKIKEQPWARQVDENDIIIDEYGPSYRYGMWKGKEVGKYYTFCHFSFDKSLTLVFMIA